MENTEYKEQRFDSYLNKIIILSSKNYYKNQMTISNNESISMDNNNYPSFLSIAKLTNSLTSNIDEINDTMELHSALNTLSAIEQAVIFLLFNEDLCQEDASKILEICSKSVSRIKLRAIDKLKKYFKGDL